MPVDLLAPPKSTGSQHRAAFAVAHCWVPIHKAALGKDVSEQVKKRVHSVTSDLASQHRATAMEVGGGFEVRFPNAPTAVRYATEWHAHIQRTSSVAGVERIRGGCGISLSRPGANADAASGRQTRETAAALARACAPGSSLICDNAIRSVLRAVTKTKIRHTDLGQVWLPHFEGSIHAWVLQAADDDSTPQIRVLPQQTNLPSNPDAFFGRGADLEAIENLFMAGEQVICLVGPGGLGKSRLAQRFAGLSYLDFAHEGGVWKVSLSGARGPDRVAANIAEAMGLPVLRQPEPVMQVSEALSERGRTLIILDDPDIQQINLEELLAIWCKAAPRAQFLVTAQQHVGSLTSHVVPSMSLDAASALFDAHMERFVDPGKDNVDLSGVREIVERVDGIPLALELAAAWTSMLSPEQLLKRLNDSLQVLSEHPARPEQTLNAVMQRSWERLDRWERLALEQISIFRGGFTVEALEGVLALPQGYGAPTTMQVLNGLRDRAMLMLNQDEMGLRFSVNAVIQDYASQSLARSGRRSGSWRRHAEWAVKYGLSLIGPANQGNVLAVRQLAARTRESAYCRRAAFPTSTYGVRATLALSALHAIRGPFSAWEGRPKSDLAPGRGGVPSPIEFGSMWRWHRRSSLKGRPETVAHRLDLIAEAFVESGRRDAEGHALLNLGLVRRAPQLG